MNNETITRKLIALRFTAEREAETTLPFIDCTLLSALDDVCSALGLSSAEKQRVLGASADLLGKPAQPTPMLPLFSQNARWN